MFLWWYSISPCLLPAFWTADLPTYFHEVLSLLTIFPLSGYRKVRVGWSGEELPVFSWDKVSELSFVDVFLTGWEVCYSSLYPARAMRVFSSDPHRKNLIGLLEEKLIKKKLTFLRPQLIRAESLNQYHICPPSASSKFTDIIICMFPPAYSSSKLQCR